MIIGLEKLRQQIKAEDIQPFYLFFGDETFLLEKAVEAIRKRVLKDSERGFNETVLDLEKSSIENVVLSAKELSFDFTRRVLIVKNARISSSVAKDTIKEQDESALLKLFSSDPAAVVIFIADEFDKRRKIAKLFLEKTTVVEFARLQAEELTAWIKRRFKELGTTIEPQALSQLIGLVGNSLRELNLECEKLAIASYSQNKTVTLELVNKLVADSRTPETFEIADCLLEKNATKAFYTLKRLLDEGVEPLMLLGLIASTFRKILIAKGMMKNGVDRGRIISTVKIPYGKQEEFFRVARRTSNETLLSLLKRISGADVAMKTSETTPRLQLEMLVLELTMTSSK
jgi:DNA polymerase-3 subunit delta